MPDSAVVATESRGQRTPPGRHTLKLLVVPIVALIVISNVGDALAPKLVESNPLLLIAMNARNRNLILVTNQLDAVSYYGVATAPAAALGPALLPHRLLVRRHRAHVDGAADQVLRLDAATVGALVPQGGVPAGVHRAQQRRSACSRERRA